MVWIAEIAPSIADPNVLARAVSDGRVLLTDDKDFGELVVREGRAHRGVGLLRLAGMPVFERAELVSRLFASASAEFVDAFTVVERDGRVWVRRAAPGPSDP